MQKRNELTSSVPILFLIFNRPKTTKRTLETIRQIRPSRIYIAADGPRSTIISDFHACAETREIATTIDWDCDVHTLFREDNQGCRQGVSGAIDWFFKQEQEGIILEDDCVPDRSFYRYCRILLEKYRHDERIMSISGNNFLQGWRRSNNSYYYSRYAHCWGWATWRRAWNHYDADLTLWPEFKQHVYLKDVEPNSFFFQRYWTTIFDRCASNQIDSWAYIWMFSCWAANGLTCLPSENLVSNIGFGQDGTHTTNHQAAFANLPTSSMKFPLVQPNIVVRDSLADMRTDRLLFRIGALQYLLLLLKHHS